MARAPLERENEELRAQIARLEQRQVQTYPARPRREVKEDEDDDDEGGGVDVKEEDDEYVLPETFAAD